MDDIPATCPKCHTVVRPTDYYCFNCGQNLHAVPPSTSIPQQILLYIGSILLPPLGFWWGIRYLRQENSTSKIVGIVCMLLTTLSIIVTVEVTMNIVNMINTQVSGQLQNIQGL